MAMQEKGQFMSSSSKGIVFAVLAALVALTLVVGALAGCGEDSTDASGASGGVVVTGMVDSATTLTVEALEDMGVETLTVEHPKKGEVAYTGVRFGAMLETLGVQSEATTVVLTASDGYTAEVPLTDVEGSADSLLAIDDGVISSVFPGLKTNTWVKDVVSMEFK